MAKPVTFNCEYCSKETTQPAAWYKRNTFHTCSRECAGSLKNKLAKTCNCVVCENKFVMPPSYHKKKTCSAQCQKQYRKKRIYINCKHCNTEFEVASSRQSTVKFCSRKCVYDSKSDKGTICKICIHCNKEFKRRKSTLIVGDKKIKNFFCSKNCKDKYLKGANHHNYVEFKYRARDKAKLIGWSLAVKERDNYVCQECGCIDKKILQSHHIKEYSKYEKLRFDIENGITLCIYCHAKKHPKYSHLILNNSNFIHNEIKKEKLDTRGCES